VFCVACTSAQGWERIPPPRKVPVERDAGRGVWPAALLLPNLGQISQNKRTPGELAVGTRCVGARLRMLSLSGRCLGAMSLGIYWDFCAGHCGKVIYSHLLVLFCPEEPRLAVPDTLPFKYPRSQMPQQTQMSVRPRTCRTVSAPRAGAGRGGGWHHRCPPTRWGLCIGTLEIQLLFSSWPCLLGGISSLLIPTLLLQRGVLGTGEREVSCNGREISCLLPQPPK